MELNISLDCLRNLEKDKFKIDAIKFQKMLLLFNAMEDGWTIKKRNNSYVFSKNHEGKKEILDESYLQKFMKSNFDLNTLIN
jgi:hypothetical protein